MNLRQKILKNETGTPEDWVAYLQDYHNRQPGISAQVFTPYVNHEGLNSYQVLAQTLLTNTQDDLVVLDLASGDGVLTEACLSIKPEAHYHLLDMSEGELNSAKSRLANVDVIYHCGLAQKTNLPTEHFDFVLCHMAFMLMISTMDVVTEIHRVLRLGGSFAGIVGRAGVGGVEDRVRQFLLSFLRDTVFVKYPTLARSLAGDKRSHSPEGLAEIFMNSPFGKAPNTKSVVVHLQDTPEKIFAFYHDIYVLNILPDVDRQHFANQFLPFLRTQADESGVVKTVFEFLYFSVEK